jgi:predicted transcriptional regulator
VRITLPLAEGVTDRLDALVEPDETRLDIIRSAIDKEVKRRERQRKDKSE